MHKNDEHAKGETFGESPGGTRSARNRKAKNAKKSVSKKEVVPVIEEDPEEDPDAKEAEGPVPGELAQGDDENQAMVVDADEGMAPEVPNQMIEEEEQDLQQQSAIVDMDQVQLQVQQDEGDAVHQADDEMAIEVEQEEPKRKPAKGGRGKKKSASQRKKGGRAAKKAKVVPEES